MKRKFYPKQKFLITISVKKAKQEANNEKQLKEEYGDLVEALYIISILDKLSKHKLVKVKRIE